MPLIRLTATPHPDINGGNPTSIFVDPSRIMTVERARNRYPDDKKAEEHQALLDQMWEELERIRGEMSGWKLNVAPESDAEVKIMQATVNMREAASALSSAYTMVFKNTQKNAYHPWVECTCISLSYGASTENGVMLARLFVMEKPEKIADLINNFWREP